MSEEAGLSPEADVDVGGSQVEGSSGGIETQTAAEAPQAAQSQPQQPASVWDAFKSLPDFQGADDRAIAQRLYQSLEREKAATKALAQYQQLLPHTREYLSNKPEYEKWLAASRGQLPQQAPQPAQQPQQQRPEDHKWWNPPEIRESYRRYLVKDANGRETIDPEAPLDAKHALYEYQKYKADFASKFLTDPEQALGPMVEQIAQQKARQIVEDQFRDYGEQQYVSKLEQENSDWLYDQQGNPTPEGLAVNKYIDEAARRGIQSPEDRWEYATMRVELDLMNQIREQEAAMKQRQGFQQALPNTPVQQAPMQAPAAPQAAPPAQNRAEADIEYLRREALRNPSRSATPPDPRIPQAPKNFKDRLAAIAAKQGLM